MYLSGIGLIHPWTDRCCFPLEHGEWDIKARLVIRLVFFHVDWTRLALFKVRMNQSDDSDPLTHPLILSSFMRLVVTCRGGSQPQSRVEYAYLWWRYCRHSPCHDPSGHFVISSSCHHVISPLIVTSPHFSYPSYHLLLPVLLHGMGHTMYVLSFPFSTARTFASTAASGSVRA